MLAFFVCILQERDGEGGGRVEHKNPFISRILMRRAFFVAIVGAFKKIDFYKEEENIFPSITFV